MMQRLIIRGEQLAARAQQRQLEGVAQELRRLFGSSAVEADGDKVVFTGKGTIKRWLTDPALRFIAGALK